MSKWRWLKIGLIKINIIGSPFVVLMGWEKMENELQLPSYYSIMTANVRYDKRLSFFEKVIYSEISALTTAKGYCFASNSFFAKIYNCSIRTITRAITKLSEYNYINVVIVKNERKIYIDINVYQPTTKMSNISIQDKTYNNISQSVDLCSLMSEIMKINKNVLT